MKITPLDKKTHKRDLFFCGVSELDEYIQKYATQDIQRNLAKVFVCEGNDPQEIRGYYTLSALSFYKNEIDSESSKKLPSYPVPAVLIGRLAVDKKYRGQGVGSFLLSDALNRVLKASETTFGIYAVVVEAKDEKACAFYKHFGFIPFKNEDNKLFIPTGTLKNL
ncbi:MAG: hypothetical protein B7Y25_01205 [Alphaproteobacteria bacterium 16-39-46]|nr:MAG: hypothetical protein B7Y25_01205 [Alphaproteobacteria bacterium 16-39-46]OZA44141.1 MAG: hypothetical protein B7X84_01275 [Alphaproteobacteria bacterium 17-39-52]HQS83516.1 GNAT family N-acetyltransferase [Alphaproteobacteria bacterium]HQS93284.1 GNAT family N-acetyltransferase [Alphaproteobacteria bacterium]